MATARFKKNGYDFYIRSYAPFSSDNKHDLLFQYVNGELSRLPKLLEHYVEKAMDTTSFDLNNYHYTENDTAEIRAILTSLHPYYKFDYEFNNFCTLINAIGEYFNALLIKASWRETEGRFAGFDPVYEKAWYMERFSALAAPYLKSFREDDSKHPQNLFYDKYRYLIGIDLPDDYETIFSIPYWKKNEVGFEHEMKTQEYIKQMLFWTLDLTAPNLANIAIPQRVWIYGNLFGAWHKEHEMVVQKRLSLKIPYLYRHGENISGSDISLKMDRISRPLEALYDSYVNSTEISEDTQNAFNVALGYAEKLASDVVHEEYEIIDLRQLLFIEILHMIEDSILIKKCKNCGRYFVVSNRNQSYCDRPIENTGKTCVNIGPSRTFRQRKEDEPALQKYTKAYNTHRMRVVNGIMGEDNFATWRLEAKAKLKKVRAGELDEDEFAKWLKK